MFFWLRDKTREWVWKWDKNRAKQNVKYFKTITELHLCCLSCRAFIAKLFIPPFVYLLFTFAKDKTRNFKSRLQNKYSSQMSPKQNVKCLRDYRNFSFISFQLVCVQQSNKNLGFVQTIFKAFICGFSITFLSPSLPSSLSLSLSLLMNFHYCTFGFIFVK